MDIQVGGTQLKNLSSINVLIGKNGCGKSSLLRMMDENRQAWTHVKYVSPERGGKTAYAPNVENNMQTNPMWFDETRRKNRDENFREKSISLLKNLETLVNRKRSNDIRDGIEPDKCEPHFDEVLGLINNLLDSVELASTDKPTPEIRGKEDKILRDDAALSSGEKELITLSVEILYFAYTLKNSSQETKNALLLLDEPDVHLHPDLQYRLINLLVSAVGDLPITTVISTHSTAILSALNRHGAHVHFMKKGETEIVFSGIDKKLEDIIPVFGAHPLSNVFSQFSLLLVEGEDDERIWQQVVRSSQGKVKLWPCETGSVDRLNLYEKRASEIIGSVYDHAQAYSIRDRDNDPYEIDDIVNVTRMRLNCYAAENLMLSDDVLYHLGTDWNSMKKKISDWLEMQESHPRYAEMVRFADGYDRRNFKIKDLVVNFMYLIGKSKPWEVAVGQAIASLNAESSKASGSLIDFLGRKAVDTLRLVP